MLLQYRQIAVSGLSLLLTACGGGSGGGLVGSGPNSGTGGTGIAAITGFSSIVLNDDRVFSLDAGTQIFIDDVLSTETELRGIGIGMMASYEVGSDVNNNITGGTLRSIHAGYNVKGPVTSINPLQVLGQTVVATGDTILTAVPASDLANLALNDEVEISGYDNTSNVIQATLIRLESAGLPVWRITGNISNVIASSSFSMGAQQINLNGVTPRNCGTGLANGDFVVVKATPDPAFNTGSVLTTVTDVECRPTGLTPPATATGNIIEAETEGLVTTLASVSDFSVRGQRVLTGPATVFAGGKAEDIVLGARLEAEGTLDISAGILNAEKIRFRQNRVRIEAPVTVPGGGLGTSFNVMGVITVNTTALTKDDDGLVNGSGMAGNQQLEVRGFVDKNNLVFAERIRNRGSADQGNVRLRGPATSTCAQSTTGFEFDILNVTVDSADAGTIFLDSRQTAAISLPNATALCNLIGIGTAVQAENGVFSSAPAARIDNAGKIEIED